MTTLHLRKSIDRSSCRRAFLLIPLVIACLICANVQAAPTWTLTNVTLTDSGSLIGSFEYDATTNTYSNILIRHIPDLIEPSPLTFTTFVAGVANSLSLFNGPPDPDGGIGRHSLVLQFSAPLTNTGGIIALSGGRATYFTGLRHQDVTGGSVSAPFVRALPTPRPRPTLAPRPTPPLP